MVNTAPIDTQLLAIPETGGSGLYGMLDVLTVSGTLWRGLTGGDDAPNPIQPRIVATSTEPFKVANAIPVEPHIAVSPSNVPDILVVPDMWLAPEDGFADRYDDVKEWLRLCWAEGTTIYSACSGSVLLASAGLLDGRTATSHWVYEDLFREAFPTVQFDPAPPLCFSDKGGRLVTAGGASSWHDLALHIIARHVSPGEAIMTAKFFLMKWHTEGQLPYASRHRQRAHADSAVRRAEDWLAANLCHGDPVSGVVAAVGVAERTLKRRFRNATGVTLITYVQNLRVEAAKQALEDSQVSVEDVAACVGYENVAFFRRLFKRTTGLSPSEYRRLYEPFRTMSTVPGAT